MARLKSEDRAAHGIKGDLVAYEMAANVLADSVRCVRRADTVLQAVAQACAGEDTPHFEADPNGGARTLVFRT